MNPTAMDRLAAAINALRPDWPTASLRTFIAANLADRAWRDAACALAWIATDPDSRTPARVLGAGPWWDTTRPAKDATPGAQPPPYRPDPVTPASREYAARAAQEARDNLRGGQPGMPEIARPDGPRTAEQPARVPELGSGPERPSDFDSAVFGGGAL